MNPSRATTTAAGRHPARLHPGLADSDHGPHVANEVPSSVGGSAHCGLAGYRTHRATTAPHLGPYLAVQVTSTARTRADQPASQEPPTERPPRKTGPVDGAGLRPALPDLAGVLDLEWTRDTGLLRARLGQLEAGDVVLTAAEETAYQRVVTRFNRMWTLGSPFDRFAY